MYLIKTFVSERRAANLLAQVRWRDTVYCPCCRAEFVILCGSYRVLQRYLCKIATVHSTIRQGRSLSTLRLVSESSSSMFTLTSASTRVSESSAWRSTFLTRRSTRASSASCVRWTRCHTSKDRWDQRGVRESRTQRPRDNWSRSRGFSTCGRGTYDKDKPPVFILANRGTGNTYVIPLKAAEKSTIRLLLAVSQQESLTVYTDRFRAYEPLDENQEMKL